MLAGQVDIINEVPIDAMSQIEQSGTARVLITNGTRTFFVALNVTRPPFNDVRVRRAANYAPDKKLIIDKLLGGAATPVAGVLSPESFGAKPGLTTYEYAPHKAKALLTEAARLVLEEIEIAAIQPWVFLGLCGVEVVGLSLLLCKPPRFQS